MSRRVLVALLFLVTIASPPAEAQVPGREVLYQFSLDIENTSEFIPIDGRADFPFTFNDLSKDSTGGLTGTPGGGVGVQRHATSWSWISEGREGYRPPGWGLSLPGTMRTLGGESVESEVRVTVNNQVDQEVFAFTLIGTTRTPSGEYEQSVNFTVYTFGRESFTVQPGGALELKPDNVGAFPFSIRNGGLLPRSFILEELENPCNMALGFDVNTVVEGKTTGQYNVTMRAPADKFWYSSEICRVSIQVAPTDQPSNTRVLILSPQIQGGYVDPTWIFNTVAVLVAAFLIFLLIARRKSRIEEEILGRPQKPWLIPVERVYLEHLRERDPQAHYVVRHFLMEEEYQSSLLWYQDFKKATKGSRAKERLVVSQEHKYKRFRKRWQRRIAAPGKKVDRLAAGLQKKLDRKGKSGARKARRNWKKLTKKMRSAHEAKVAKATKKWDGQVRKWEKQVARAEKKGTPVPAKPDAPAIAEPDYPPEPSGDRVLLESHKWNKKVVKARAKATKKAGNLEVKFEKKDARRLRKVRRKVQKIARKLDDPEFASEHPLLTQAD